MSIFGKIKDLIFGGAAHAEPAPVPAPGTAASAPTPTAASGAPAPAAKAAAPAAKAAPMAQVDVAASLDRIADERDEDLGDLDWRKSIVDLMKILDIYSSLKARKQLADELGYTGDKNDSAKMNIWLHKQVMTKLAENGGKVPAELKH